MINPATIDQFLARKLESFDWIKLEDEAAIAAALNALNPAPKLGRLWLHQQICFLLVETLKRFMLHLAMGSGKTLVVLSILRYRKQCGEQPKAIVFVPYITAVETWVEETAKHTPELKCVPLTGTTKENLHALLHEQGDLYVLCYQSAVAMLAQPAKKGRGKKAWAINPQWVREVFKGFDTLIMDEAHKCFLAGTMIRTSVGDCPIETLKIGDLVDTGYGYRPVLQIINSVSNNIIRLVFADGSVLNCTPDHPFLTATGWTEAQYLEGKNVYKTSTHIELSGMWQCFQLYYIRVKYWPQILWQKLFSKMENEATQIFRGFQNKRIQAKMQQTNARFSTPHQKRGGSPLINKCEDEKIESNSHAWGCSENFANTQSTWNWFGTKPRGERKTNKVTIPVASFFRVRLGTRSSNKDILRATRSISKFLQGGYWKQKTKNCNRVRWSFSQQPKEKETGLKERYSAGQIGVVSVSREKQRHFTPVFNIEVCGFPHYFANGVLVHNCKSVTSLTYKMCRAISSTASYAVGLTGTPFGRDLQDLWPQFYLVDFGATLGPSLGFYREVFFRKKQNYWGGFEYEFKKPMFPDLQRMIKNCSIRYSVDELHDMPPKEYIIKRVKPHEGIKAYADQSLEKIRQALSVTHEGERYRAIESQYLKLRQLASGFMTFTGMEDEKGKKDKIQIKFDENPKLDLLEELVESMAFDAKMVVFHHFVYTNYLISERLKALKVKHARIWGGQRDPIGELRKFKQEAECRVLVINSKSGSSSLNLQNAQYVVFFEQPDAAIDRQQAEARVWRAGQDKRVMIFDFLMNETVDAHQHKWNKDGENLLTALLDGRVKL